MTGNATRRVLLTGASGFIGSHCIQPLLDRGFEVVAAGHARQRAAQPGVQWIQADLLAPGGPTRLIEQARASHLLHLAWYVEPGAMIASPVNLAWVRSSLELVEQFRTAQGARCVVGGSCYEYDWRYGYCSEALTPCKPDTMYGAAKHGLAQVLGGHAAASGLSFAWGRMFFLYGPNENPKRLVPSVALSMLKGEPALSSHGLQVRDYMHVQDVADGLVALLDSDCNGAYNIATGQATTIATIVRTLGEISGRPDLVRLGALPARANDAPVVLGDPAAARRDFGWSASIGLQQGLEATVQWWRQQAKA